VAGKLADFVAQATRTLDICIYSFRLCDETLAVLMPALEGRVKAGVRIRIAYDAGSQQSAIAQPGHLVCASDTEQFVRSLPFESKAVTGERALMHHKYIVLDAGTPQAQVWTGSANFTDDSWTLQENNILTLRSERLAEFYTHDFEELWVDGLIVSDGLMDSGEATLEYAGDPAHVLVNFSPGEGEWMDKSIAMQIDRTQERITLACVVVTSTRILTALTQAMERGVAIDGLFDWSQMEGVKYQWKGVPHNHWKIPAFERIVEYGNLVGKRSTPYTPTSKHDFMHNKVMVADDVVITGSYNFSRHAQSNAENLLLIHSPALAVTYRDYIGGLVQRYGDPSNPESSKSPKPKATPKQQDPNI
jgi:phosphatidylserine/phosphatidylglycerophosphate/cardiolipin synthase-like enzyme